MWGYDSRTSLYGGYEPQSYAEESNARGATSGAKSNPTMGSGNDWTWAYGSPQDFKVGNTGSSRRGGYAGSVGGGGSSRSSVTRSTVKFTEPMPDLPDLPTLELSKVDPRKVRALTQKAAAPNIRALREQMQVAMNAKSDNPNVRRMTLREALQGYGTGLERAMSGASAQARQEHQQEINVENQEKGQNYNTRVNALMQQYSNAFNRYLQSAERVSTTDSTTDGGGAGGPGGTVVRRNVWGTPTLGPTFQDAWDARIAGTSYGNFVNSRR